MAVVGLLGTGLWRGDRRLVIMLACLAAPLGCTKADFGDAGATGGTGGGDLGGTGGTIDGSGGSPGNDGGSGGEPMLTDGGDTAASDGAVDENPGLDLTPDSAKDLGNGDLPDGPSADVPPDGPTGVQPNAPGQLLISEVMYDSAALADDYGEWFEVYNPSPDVTYNLLGCGASDKSPSHTHIINKAVIVPPHGYRTFALSAPGGAAGTDPGFTPDYVYAGFKLDNDLPDRVTFTCAGTVIDQFDYTPPVPAMPGRTLSVDPAHLNAAEHNLPTSYCRAQTLLQSTGLGTDYGTPGGVNPSCP